MAADELLPGYYVDEATGAWLTLPWPAELPPSLGPQIIRWAEWRTYEEDGRPGLTDYTTGERWVFTQRQRRFLHLWYAYNPATGRWLYRRGVKRGAKGTGKDPFGAAMCNIELIGPCRLVRAGDGWTGERHRMPLVQIAANSEAQAKDVLRVANAMLGHETRAYYSIDTGETRTILEDSGGRLELLTASEKSAEGDPSTFIMLNESHHMTESNGGHDTARVARRNVGKSPAYLQARLCEFTNAHQQGADSVAERSFEAWQAQVSGRARRQDILYDSIEAPPSTDMLDDESRMAGLRAAYLDADWADLERLSDEMLDPDTSVADSVRYYLNGLATAEDAWIDPRKFDELAAPDDVVEDGEQVALFLDCSKSTDATVLCGCRIDDGHVFALGIWQRPHGDRGKGWLAPREQVDATARAALGRYSVQWFGVDPSPARDDEDEAPYWKDIVDGLHRDFGKKLPLWATRGEKIGNAVSFDMRLSQPGGRERVRLFTEEAELVAAAIDDDESPERLTWDGSPALRLHTHNARRRPNQWGVSLGKASRSSSKLVDYAVAMVGARLGRRLVLNSGKRRRKRDRKAMFV